MTNDHDIGELEGWIREMSVRDRPQLASEMDTIAEQAGLFIQSDQQEHLRKAVGLIGQIGDFYSGVPYGEPFDELVRIKGMLPAVKAAVENIGRGNKDIGALRQAADEVKRTYDDFVQRRECYQTRATELKMRAI